MQGKMKKPVKKRASLRNYVSENQLTFPEFASPFGDLDKNNRWIKLSNKIPWDDIVSLYSKHHPAKSTGRPPLNPRILIGSVMIKHLSDYDDRETIEQIRENIYLQYFLGFKGFSTEAPFDASLFVEIRKKLTPSLLGAINDRLLSHANENLLPSFSLEDKKDTSEQEEGSDDDSPASNKGTVIVDATVAPQGIAYPTDLNLLNDAREMSEKIIDFLCMDFKESLSEAQFSLHLLNASDTLLSITMDIETQRTRDQKIIDTLQGFKKPRTYRQNARKDYLRTAQNKKPSRKKVRLAVGKQLRYLRRNLNHIEHLLDLSDELTLGFPLPRELQRYYWVIQLLFDQQLEMFEQKKHQVADRLVSIHQPHVRPIVRGKAKAPTEFGAKLHLSLVDGYCFLDTISWDAFHEGSYLIEYIKKYKERYGYFPEKVLADKIYATRENRKWLKERGIRLSAKPLGRPSAKAVVNHISPGERNPIEGKFGQAKTAYGLNRIRAKLANTSESWITSIIMVLNLVKWARQAAYCFDLSSFSYGARQLLRQIRHYLSNQHFIISYEFEKRHIPFIGT